VPRPQKHRRVASPPVFTDYKPTRVPTRLLDTVDLTLDEYESIRLSEYLRKSHAEAAGEMGVSRPTFTRLHDRAWQKVGKFLVEGLHLSIAGGMIHFQQNLHHCNGCGKVFPTAIAAEVSACPFCGSDQLDDLAAEHGHGECCREK